VNGTAKFSVLDLASAKVNHLAGIVDKKKPTTTTTSSEGAGGGAPGREKTRLTQSTGQSIKKGGGKIGGEFKLTPNPPYLAERVQVYERLAAKQEEKLSGEWWW